MSVDIHLCGDDEIALVMQFVEKYWARGHVLAHDRALTDWQYRRAEGGYNFVVATKTDDPELLAVLGFIPTTRYDPALTGHETVWLALWKVRPDASSAGLGLALLRHATAMHPGSAIGVVGIGPPEHIGMYRALGFETGELSQYYMLDATRTDFKIADIPPSITAARPGGNARLTPLSEGEFLAATERVRLPLRTTGRPLKTPGYFRARFFRHPVYSYNLYLVEAEAGDGILATRLASHDGRTVLRLVDFLGDEGVFAELGRAAQSLIEDTGSEYADIWNAGFARSTFARAGFSALDPDGDVIIPNYFEPFLKRNGRISFALRPGAGSALAIFRADGDQDRPNLVPRR